MLTSAELSVQTRGRAAGGDCRPAILFLSGLDFKERSIQVIRKTPEAFRDAGWDVTYVVMRDSRKRGNYSYERVFEPDGIRVVRFSLPGERFIDRLPAGVVTTIATKIASWIGVLNLARHGYRELRQRRVDVVYGYEHLGVLAAGLLRFFGIWRGPFVSRFQGSHLFGYIRQKRWLKVLLNADHLLAIRMRSDLTIMTDDGTEGDKLFRWLRAPAPQRFRFWANGIDVPPVLPARNEARRALSIDEHDITLLTICRLVSWKRVDRALYAIQQAREKLPRNLRYVVVGEGPERQALEALAARLGIDDCVHFVGAVPHEQTWQWYAAADIYLSTYDSSNVGNPLFEAIACRLPVVTLDNGTTSEWVRHGFNGMLYPVDESTIRNLADGLVRLAGDPALRAQYAQAQATVAQRLKTWKERLDMEVKAVCELCDAEP